MTAQQRELLIYNGNEYHLASEPFNQYIYKNKIDLRLEVPITSLWRGYYGHWEITDNKLYLTKIEGQGVIRNQEKYKAGRLALRKKCRAGLITPQQNGHLLKELENACLEKIKLSLKSLFNTRKKVHASWYTGNIIAPYGKLVQYIHIGYASVYERQLIFQIEDGVLLNVVDQETPPEA
jgi:hypothetical protein